MISPSCAELLSENYGSITTELFERMLNVKQCSYPDDLKSFALTLHFYSPKAYEYVRDTFGLALPHNRTIREWYAGVDGDPGFTKSAFQALRLRCKEGEQKGKRVIVALMLDEMAIRKHVEFSNGKFHGFVDVGAGVTSDSAPLAKDALVLMAVALKESWKIPLGYFLLDGISGAEKANLVIECITRLHQVGVHVASITCDGPAAHLAMFKRLGVDLSTIPSQPCFQHPCDPAFPVYVILEPCHVLKLMRNAWAERGTFVTENGEKIEWRFIEELHKFSKARDSVWPTVWPAGIWHGGSKK